MTITATHPGNSYASLARSVARLGIEVPANVNDESALYQRLQASRQTVEGEYTEALSRLMTAPLAEFDAAREDLVDASLGVFAVSNGVDEALLNVSADRLHNVVYDASAAWQAEVVRQFNDVVAEFDLNRVARHLPNFADPGSFKVLSLTTEQGDAVDRWRTASGKLRPLWDVYVGLARFHGNDVGPIGGADDRSVNLFTACALGDPGSFGTASAAATYFAGKGSDSAAAWNVLFPFVIPLLAGYELNLYTVAGATAIRGRIQPGA